MGHRRLFLLCSVDVQLPWQLKVVLRSYTLELFICVLILRSCSSNRSVVSAISFFTSLNLNIGNNVMFRTSFVYGSSAGLSIAQMKTLDQTQSILQKLVAPTGSK